MDVGQEHLQGFQDQETQWSSRKKRQQQRDHAACQLKTFKNIFHFLWDSQNMRQYRYMCGSQIKANTAG